MHQNQKFETDYGIYLKYISSEDGVENTPLNNGYSNLNLGAYYMREERYFTWKIGGTVQQQKYNWYGLPDITFDDESIASILKNRIILREHFVNEVPSESRSNASNKLDRKFISEFTSIIESNLSNEDLSVDDIYKGLGISKIQLYRKTKALLGFSVNDYILSVRLQKAKYLLMNEDLTISEVAYKVGFSSQAYFSTVFKSKFSVTPSEFKESSKK